MHLIWTRGLVPGSGASAAVCALTGMTLHAEMQLKCQLKTHVMSRLIRLVKLEAEEKVFSVFGGAPNTGTLWVSLILEGLWTEGTGPTDLPPSCSPSDCHCFFNGKKA